MSIARSKNKIYLVTGGLGFIGSAVVRELVNDGNSVRIFDNFSRNSKINKNEIANDRVKLIEGDIRNERQLSIAAEGVDSIIHLAYVNGTDRFYRQPELVLDVAIAGIVNLFSVCRKKKIKEIIIASSSEVYHYPNKIPTPENVPLVIPDVCNPRYSYGGGKIIYELMAMNYGKDYFERVLIFRPHNIYGPNMGFEHVIPQLTLRAIKATTDQPKSTIKFPLYGGGKQTRAFCHINDFISGFRTMLHHGKDREIYNIGVTEETKILAVATKIFSIFGRDAVFTNIPSPLGETSRRCPDIQKLKKLGYKPNVSLEVGLTSTVDWYRRYNGVRK